MNRITMRRKYSHFTDLVAAAAARELSFLILSAEYTKGFSLRLKHIMDELNGRERDLASVSVMFNTEGDIAIIDEALIGRFVAIKFNSTMEEYYKGASLNRIAKAVMEGEEKRIMDFLSLCYDVLYDSIEEMYKEVRCRKDVMENFKKRYNIASYNREDSPVVTAVLMIMEDIINYLGIKESYILTISAIKVRKTFSQSF